MEKLNLYIDKKNISGAKFAKLIGCSRMTISRYLSGKCIPSVEIMQKIFIVTNGDVTPNDFYNISNIKNLSHTPSMKLDHGGACM